MLKVIEAASRMEPDGSRGMVVIESSVTGPPFQKAFDELEAQAAVQMAQQYASSKGCAPALLNGNKQGPYPVNSEGLPLEEVRGPKGESLPQTDPRMQPVRYRVDVPVARSMR